MSELGQQLRQAREARGLTLADVEAEIKIRQPILQAIEAGSTAELPPLAFSRGLVRKYAGYLNLDPGWAVELFERENGRVQPARFAPVLEEPLYRRGRAWSEILLTAGVALLCVIVAAAVWQYSIMPLRQTVRPTSGTSAPAASQAAATPVAPGEATETPGSSSIALAVASPTLPPPAPSPTRTPVLEPTPAGVVPPTPTLLPTIGATHTPEPPTPAPTTPPNEVEVSVEITQPSWVAVSVDGKQVFARILQPGQNMAWRGQKSVVLRTGNAGGTIIFVNGQSIGTLGSPGAVIEREWQMGQGDVIMVNPNQNQSQPQNQAPPPPPTATPQS
ncbi:MAG: DUF4115 domain-containing protein [Anaerolineae bacterium]|nr:DUF4115 domain-containing protein [Anaerolineae bacterium]